MLQNIVYLSLGSNIGDKQKNLNLAIELIHQWVATVVEVSGTYLSKSWGFNGNDFYNCNLKIHTLHTANQLLKKLQKVEVQMGRLQKIKVGYEDRIIDIDILFFNNEIIENKSLTIPHVKIQDRNFVLLPMLELSKDIVHPVLNKTIEELNEDCDDSIKCEKMEESNYQLRFSNSLNYIAIEGNIGIGKTTLATKIAEDFNAKLVLERFADNPFLPKFYEDIKRYAFPLEVSFLADRYKQMSDDLAQFDIFKEFIIADYYIFKSIIFAQITLAEDELKLYKTLFDIIYKETPKPDIYIYLYQNTDTLLKNIQKRGRNYEKSIDANYLEKINNGYLEFIKNQINLNVHIVDVSEKNFVDKQEDYQWVLSKINAIIKK